MRVSIDDRLARLCGGFSVAKIGEWLERKFASYDTSKAVSLSVVENKNDREYFKSARLLGYVRELPERVAAGTAAGGTPEAAVNRPLLVAAVEMRKILTERTSRQAQFNFAKRVLQNAVRGGAAGLDGYPSQGLFFFYDQDGFFRISLVSGEMDGRKFKFNEAKRQSFFINPNRPNNVAKARLSEPIETYADLKAAFSVEALTKEFYGKLFAWYEWAMKQKTGVRFPNELGDNGKDDQAYNAIALIRLITRLMFTWFLRQRDLVPALLFDENALGELLKKADLQSNDEDNYYRCVLQNLFFATLNCDPRHRVRRFVKVFQGRSDAADTGITTLYRYENEFRDAKRFLDEMRKIPFLNCALFDCLDNIVYEDRKTGKRSVFCYDGFSRAKARRAHVPNALFFDAERGLVKLFDAYEFTVDENKADDADVALDPELLGKVFENLLGAYNEETRETARKATGSFYSPREIVDYMVAAALKNLIKAKLPSVKDEWLKALFDPREEPCELPFDDDVARAISDVLYSCRVLDPACGSGAFPMGILNCMVRVLCRLDPSNLILKKKVADIYFAEKGQLDPNLPKAVVEERRAEIEYSFKTGQLHPEYMRKMLIIERCIYGVDIQPIAIQISKLRFFISLLCDQFREIRDDAQENRGILSLPQLEANFVCANTLVSLPKVDEELGLTYDILEPKRLELAANRHEIFRARSVERKEALKAKDRQIREEIRESVYNLLAKPDDAKIRMLEEQIAAKRTERKTVEKEVWEEREIWEQPDLFSPSVKRKIRVDRNAARRTAIDGSIDQAEAEIRREKAKAEKRHATLSADYADMVSGWDPYDQHATSKFFDPKWMFNIEDGFDIVIGNPPYVQLQANGGALAKLYQDKGFETFDRTGDVYCLFYERGFELSSEEGTLCYITSNKWMRAGYGQSLRRFFAVKTNPSLLIDFAGEKIFESASVDTNIIVLGHGINKKNTLSVVATAQCRDRLSEFVTECASASAYETDEPWLILSSVEKKLSESLNNGTPLGKFGVRINLGIKTGLNEAFVIDEETRNEILVCCADSTERQRTKKILMPLVRGRDIARYGKNWAGLYLVGMHNGNGVAVREHISHYPALKRFMDRYKTELSKRSDKGDTPYNLRDCAYWEDFDKPKLIWADIMRVRKDDAERFPRFSYCDEGYFANNSCYIAVGKDLKYILGVLNSAVGRYQCYKEIVVLDNGGFRMWKEPVERLRIAKATPDQQQPIVALVDRILAAKKKDPDADTSALEAQIDQLVYKLYGLTEEEIAVVEGRGGEKCDVGAGGGKCDVGAGGGRGATALPTTRGHAGRETLPWRRGGRVDATVAVEDDDEELE